MNELFKEKGNREVSTNVLEAFTTDVIGEHVSEVFKPYTGIRFDYFKPSHDIKRKLRNPKNEKPLQSRRQNDKNFNKFYETYCSSFKFETNQKIRQVLENNESLHKLQPKELYQKIKQQNSGNIYFLIGEVGCGKSTYLSSFLREFEKQEPKKDTPGSGLFIFIARFSSIRQLYKEGKTQDQVVIELLSSILNPYLKVNHRLGAYATVEEFIEYCMRGFRNHRLIFAFDDIDDIYDEYNQKIFSYPGVANEFRDWEQNNQKQYLFQIMKKIIAAMKKFRGQNIDFILSLRPNTYNIVSHTGLGVSNHDNKCIFLKIDKQDIVGKEGILENRLKMFRDKADINDIEVIKSNLEKFADVSMDHKLHGLRHFIDNTSFVFSKNKDKLREEWMFEMFTYLDNNNTYTQNKLGGVLNIFLVNSKYRKDSDDPSAPKYPKYPDYIKAEHLQTYWLKYLISCCFYEKQQSDQSMYEAYFSKYERSIYQLCIYSLTEVQHGRLISCVPNNNDVRSLRITERLAYCSGTGVQENLFFKFTYISLIVDDAYLQIPNILTDDKKFMECWIYKSFFPDNEKETNEWKEWLRCSIYKVFLFMKVLKISWEQHEVKFLLGGLDKYKPDFKKIHEKQIEDITKIANSLEFENIEEVITETLKEQKEYDDKLISFFSLLSTNASKQLQ